MPGEHASPRMVDDRFRFFFNFHTRWAVDQGRPYVPVSWASASMAAAAIHPVPLLICAPPAEPEGVIPSPVPAGILGPLFVRPLCELALDFAGGVLVGFAEGILGNLGDMQRRDVPGEVARRLIRA